jgi:hypothetical protein
MIKSSRRPQDNRRSSRTEPVLELPDPAGFVSKTFRIGLDRMLAFSEARLHLFDSRPGAEEQRLWEKCDVPFEL